jgi:hypothetical protein
MTRKDKPAELQKLYVQLHEEPIKESDKAPVILKMPLLKEPEETKNEP